MSAPFDLSNPNRPVHAGVILMNSTTEILDVAPIDLLSALSSNLDFEVPAEVEDLMPASLKAQAIDFRFHWVSEGGPSKIMKMTSGIQLTPTDSFETCPPLDIVLMGAHDINYAMSEAEIAFVRKAYEESSAFLTICGGVLVPVTAGLLAGKTVTGPRPYLNMLKKQAPHLNWVEKRWTRDGKVWTSSTLLNGTDMMINFAKATWGNRHPDGEPNIVDFAEQLGAWPSRDVDFKDVPWAM